MAEQNRKLIVCCDGTWNQPFKKGAPTNVVKMVRPIQPKDANGISQLVYYHPGVGTGNLVDKVMGGFVGVGLSANVQSAYDFLVNNYVDGDDIYIFGFSRGAFTARSLAGLVGLIGLLEKRDMDLFRRIYKFYRSRKHRSALKSGQRAHLENAIQRLFWRERWDGEYRQIADAIERARPTQILFLGVWDTVGSLGIPFGILRWIGRWRYNFHDTELSEFVRFAYHALAVDERRGNFKPTLWTRPIGRGSNASLRKQTLEQAWFVGSHSNVGGGYDDCGLSDTAFLWMVEKAASASYHEGRPLAFDDEFLRTKIDQGVGESIDSRKGFWKLLPGFPRSIAEPREGLETCEVIHSSVRDRYECSEDGLFKPFPYKPPNLAKLFSNQQVVTVAQLGDIEKTYRTTQTAKAKSAAQTEAPKTVA